MRRPVTEREIRFIQKNEFDFSIREMARHLGRSPTFVQRVMNGTWEEKTKKRPGPKGLDDFSRIVFTEYARISRYKVSEICEFLSPLLPILPSMGSHKRQTITLPVCKKTLYRILKSARVTVGDVENRHSIVAIHRIPIQWLMGGGTGEEAHPAELKKGEILCLFERLTGCVYLQAYNRVAYSSVTHCLSVFSKFNYLSPKAHVLIGGQKAWQFGRRAKGQKSAKSFREGLDEDFSEDLNFREEPFPDGKKPETLVLPGTFRSLKDLNEELIRIINGYLFTPRVNKAGKESDRFSPVARQWAAYQNEENRYHPRIIPLIRSRKTLEKRMRLRSGVRPRSISKSDYDKIMAEE